MPSNFLSRRANWALAVCVCMLLFGCDHRPKRHLVSGIVTVDGKPLTKGIVTIIPEGARPSYGMVGDDGRFTMTCYGDNDGVIPGTHRVAIRGGEPLGPTKTRWHAPKKYADVNTSELTATIEDDVEDLTYDLKWDGGKPYIEDTARSSYEETSDDI